MALRDNQQEDNAIATAQTELDDLSRTLGVTHLALDNKSQNASGVATATSEYYWHCCHCGFSNGYIYNLDCAYGCNHWRCKNCDIWAGGLNSKWTPRSRFP